MISVILFLFPFIFEIKFEIVELVTEFEKCDVECSKKNAKMPFLHQVWINQSFVALADVLVRGPDRGSLRTIIEFKCYNVGNNT